jgi:ABC-type amino acid transport substrate-binding protein
MDIRPPVAVKAVSASSAQVRHRVRPAAKTAKAHVAASRASLVPASSKIPPQPGRRTVVATASEQPESKASNKEKSAFPDPAQRNRAAASEPVSPDNTDLLVAILMVGPDIKSVSDLKGKTIAIDDRYSASGGTVRTAIVAAGAPQVQLSEGQGTAMNRLSNGEVSGAVVALVTPDAADKFPAFAGYRIFQVPLSPDSLKAQP